ncbi:MAG: ABC transporter ATP-binding protein [Bryobacterales bacterium]|nr:ABC transporter ATP-binding protein [Bryobacterales bacterium]MBV9401611.1 ABC transporter ATP-binding protein [Bryobacterales bacterium]
MPALIFDQVTKTFPHHPGQMLLRDRIREMVHPSTSMHGTRFEALKDVSFELARGESLGLIGANGAGKSTLLNLATGCAKPDFGRVVVNGKVSALLELTAGFHGDLTGAENLRINAALNGLTRRQTADRFEEIVEFSGVRDFINEPLRTYSSGMAMRLAFSVAVHTDPDILLIDEVIGVGDQDFAVKCLDKIKQFQREGKTILLASHANELLNMLCERALWLDHGHLVKIGPAAAVTAAYASGQTPLAAAAFAFD